jgi:hypothetical protein
MSGAAILEPISTGDVIDRSVRIYRRNLRALLITAAGPFLFGTASWLCLRLGLNGLNPGVRGSGSPIGSGILILVGFVSYVFYLYVMVLVVAGLARAVGDYLMLGREITVRGVISALRGRIGDLTVASLLLVGAVILIFVVFFAVFFAAVMVAGLSAVAIAALQLPPVIGGVIFAVVFLAAFGSVSFFVLPVLVARVVFIPQVVMIEGASAGNAAARAFSLGAKCWRGVLAVLLFTYCSAFSLTLAVMTPVVIALWVSGLLSMDLERWDSIYGGVGQFASFLLVPVWAISFTLLYFDSRVRKEGYDVDLLARKLPIPAGAPRQVAWAPRPAAPVVAASGPAEGLCPRCGAYLLTGGTYCSTCGWHGVR